MRTIIFFLAVSATTAACSSNDEATPDPTPAIDQAKVAARLYYDTEANLTIDQDATAQSLSFDARGDGHKINLAVTSTSNVDVKLYAKAVRENEFKLVASGAGEGTVRVGDDSDGVHNYRLDVTAARGVSARVMLTCDAEDHAACAVARQPSDICGGFVAQASKCDQGLFCNLVRNTCGNGDQGGRCLKPPTVCTKELALVCGCDGKTYDNACAAQTALASVAHDGKCTGAE